MFIRDRKGEYEPQVVKKRQTDITGLESKIISMYAKGMSTRDIQEHFWLTVLNELRNKRSQRCFDF